ncbi:MAG: hypothetical protein FE038_01840 [Thermoplasmata archaeon]|nr:MAG: hypothetical protein FE038_01840 [Thermoplasmata archaeon]
MTRWHDNVCELHLENGKVLKPTANHPFLTKGKGWTTISGLDELGMGAGKLEVGDYLYCLNSDGELEEVRVVDIVPVEGSYLTYNLVDMKYGTFLADDIVTHNSMGKTCVMDYTSVWTQGAASVYKKIEDFKPGDPIKCCNEETGEVVDGTVVKVYKYQADEIITVNEIGMVPGHQINVGGSYDPSQGKYATGTWVRSEKLTTDDSITVDRLSGNFITYNLQVEPYNNYFVLNDKGEKVLVRGTTDFNTPPGFTPGTAVSHTGGSWSKVDIGKPPSYVITNDDGQMRIKTLGSGMAYGILDPSKIRALKNNVSYNLARETLLGSDSTYDFNISITTMNGAKLLSYGKSYKKGGSGDIFQ